MTDILNEAILFSKALCFVVYLDIPYYGGATCLSWHDIENKVYVQIKITALNSTFFLKLGVSLTSRFWMMNISK